MRDWKEETRLRVEFIRQQLKQAGAKGIVYGNSGGKDSALVGILCKMACDNTIGVLMPCHSSRNYGQDMEDGLKVAHQFHIKTLTVDLTPVRQALLDAMKETACPPSETAVKNIAPRLRMTTLYSLAQTESCLVAGTGNRSEAYLGYFTKWGDGAYDFNPIGDLTVTEILAFLKALDAPAEVIEKAPSAGLYDGQTDEDEMGVRYGDVDLYLLGHKEQPPEKASKMHRASAHKRHLPVTYGSSQTL